MKQKFTKVILSVLFLTAAFTACEKEGVYKPQKKISRVIDKQNVVYIYETLPSYETIQYENWIWEDNLLKYIQNRNSLSEFFYDGTRLSKIKMDDDLAIFHYKNLNLDFIEIMSYGHLYTISVEEREKGKITKLEIKKEGEAKYGGEAKYAFERVASLLKLFISDPIVDILSKEQAKQSELATHAKGLLTMEIEVEYERDNVSELQIFYYDDYSSANYHRNYVFTYDSKKNPYYHALQLLPTSNGTDFGLLLSKNNELSYWEKSEPEYVVNYQYTYDGDYPESKIYSLSIEELYHTYTYTHTIAFEFID